MRNTGHKFIYAALALAATMLAAQTAIRSETRFAAYSNLGSESLLLRPAKRPISLMATLESKDLERIRVITTEDFRQVLRYEDGSPVKNYPDEIAVRFSAGMKTVLEDSHPFEIYTPLTPQQFVDSLHFRLKIFHGIDYRVVDPASVQVLGVPMDVPYDERILRIKFRLDHVPVEDRMVLEILDAAGERVTKFHIQLL